MKDVKFDGVSQIHKSFEKFTHFIHAFDKVDSARVKIMQNLCKDKNTFIG